MEQAKLLKNKVIVVTGAGRGIGRATAMALVEAGAHVVVAARSPRAIEAVTAEIRASGGQALAIPTDVSDPASVDLLAMQALRAAGRIDILINNAGVIAPIGMTWEVPPLIWQRNVDINLIGPFLCTHAVLPHMIHQPPHGHVRGKIINVSSGAAVSPVPGWSAYSAAKAGVDQFTRVLAAEVKDHNITVNGVWPGIVDTHMQSEIRRVSPDRFPEQNRFEGYYQMDQLRSPVEVAQLLLWLASPFADDMTGQIVRIDDEEIRQRVANDLGEATSEGRGGDATV
jgi:NAD(P)-dependent dehydrogenase (short-subunit alcohol dehydrogenase family)